MGDIWYQTQTKMGENSKQRNGMAIEKTKLDLAKKGGDRLRHWKHHGWWIRSAHESEVIVHERSDGKNVVGVHSSSHDF